MANKLKERASYFSADEQETIMTAYEEFKNIIMAKSNTATAARARQEAWQNIKLNACNPATKRTWEQVKTKHKNVIQNANKKRADMVKTGGGPKTPDFTPAEELALQHNRGRPIMEGIAGGSSSGEVGSTERRPYLKVAGPSVILLQPPPIVLVGGGEPTDGASPDDGETVSAFSGDMANPAGPQPDPPEPGPSHSAGTGDGEVDNEDVRTLYKRYLRAEIAYRQLKMRKLHKETALLDRQLDADQ